MIPLLVDQVVTINRKRIFRTLIRKLRISVFRVLNSSLTVFFAVRLQRKPLLEPLSDPTESVLSLLPVEIAYGER